VKKSFIAIISATIWISLSEFGRNEFLLKEFWVNHYAGLGLVFPGEAVNGMIWGVWSLLLAVFIFIISRKFSLVSTTFITWLAAFVLMWLVVGNMAVLPFGILVYAIPLSLIEVALASWIILKIQPVSPT
jgi:hypothetical protein